MDAFIEFVQNWGYLAVFLGSLIEGESVILTASAMARLGHLSILKVAIIAFFGTLVADQGLFFLGRYYGDAIFNRFPILRRKTVKAFELLHKYDAAYIVACRFIYGIRILSPIVIGAAGVKPVRFMPLNFISALVWATVSCTGGYWLGGVMLEIFDYFFMAQKYLIAAVMGSLITILVIIKLRHYLKTQKK